MKSIFVSHVFEDNSYLNKMLKWQEKGLMDGYLFTYENEDQRVKGEKEIKDILKNKIKGCAILLVLVGDNTHNHDWIKLEVELANNFNKKICCVRIPNSRGKKPQILNKHKELAFHSNQILKELNAK
ncbi:TIR domain-containing protein [Nonlabens sp. Asnod2-A12]|uniref:TIR domain-containing protein n=1 Tax=Nonlabens sp. Asnod2-A12 TaxID=3160578 RepID=UPI003870BCEB